MSDYEISAEIWIPQPDNATRILQFVTFINSVTSNHRKIGDPIWHNPNRHRWISFYLRHTRHFKIAFEIFVRNNYLIIHVHGHSENKNIVISTIRRSQRSHVLRPRFSNYNDTLCFVQPKIVRVRQFDHCLSKSAIRSHAHWNKRRDVVARRILFITIQK